MRVRVLLDENLPHKLRSLFADGIEVVTVGHQGWKGKENGELLRVAENAFDAFITIDQGIPHQQNFGSMNIGIVLLEAESNRYEALSLLIPQVNVVLETLSNGQVVRVKS